MSRLAARYLMEVEARQLSNEWLHRSFKSQLRWINTLKFHAFTLNHFSTHSVYLNGGGTLRLKRWKKNLKSAGTRQMENFKAFVDKSHLNGQTLGFNPQLHLPLYTFQNDRGHSQTHFHKKLSLEI